MKQPKDEQTIIDRYVNYKFLCETLMQENITMKHFKKGVLLIEEDNFFGIKFGKGMKFLCFMTNEVSK